MVGGIGKKARMQFIIILAACNGVITVQKATESLGIESNRVCNLLTYLEKNGWIRRVKRGVYVPVPAVGASDEYDFLDEPWLLAHEVYHPCYIGGWTAAQHWDFTEQIYQSVCVVTSKRVNSHNKKIDNEVIRIKKCSSDQMFGTAPFWIGKTKIAISDPTKTIIDILNDPLLAGGIRPATDMLLSYLRSEHFDELLLLEYAAKMKNRTILKRLGFLVEKFSPKCDKIIKNCRENLSKGYSFLDPKVKDNFLIKKWRLWVPKSFKDVKEFRDR